MMAIGERWNRLSVALALAAAFRILVRLCLFLFASLYVLISWNSTCLKHEKV